MPRCAANTEGGRPCERIVSAGQTYCYSHDPARQNERRRNAARGGKAKASGEVRRVKAKLQALADMVLEGTLDRADAAVVSQIWNVYLSAVRTELKVREVEELAHEVEELREMLERSRKWA